jgi:AcrR family transcriptional regulator
MKKKINIEIIYQTALENFAKYGLRKTTLDDIAGDLGVTSSNLYRYTNSKDSLYHEAVAFALHRWQDKVVASLTGIESPKEKLVTLCTRAFTYLSEDKIFCEILRNDPNIFPVFSSEDHYSEINQKSINLLRDIIRDGIQQNLFREVDEEQIALSFFSIYKMFIIYTYIQPEENFVENLFMKTLDLLTQGLFVG